MLNTIPLSSINPKQNSSWKLWKYSSSLPPFPSFLYSNESKFDQPISAPYLQYDPVSVRHLESMHKFRPNSMNTLRFPHSRNMSYIPSCPALLTLPLHKMAPTSLPGASCSNMPPFECTGIETPRVSTKRFPFHYLHLFALEPNHRRLRRRRRHRHRSFASYLIPRTFSRCLLVAVLPIGCTNHSVPFVARCWSCRPWLDSCMKLEGEFMPGNGWSVFVWISNWSIFNMHMTGWEAWGRWGETPLHFLQGWWDIEHKEVLGKSSRWETFGTFVR